MLTDALEQRGLERPAVFDYSKSDLIAALRDAGLNSGDLVYLHVCADTLGVPEGAASVAERSEVLLDSVMSVIGPEGTLLAPAYSFSFCRQEAFDVDNTPCSAGPWSTSVEFLEYFRTLPGTIRSSDPIHSVTGRGPLAATLLQGLPATCFGPDSVHDRIRKLGGKICTLGVGLHESTFRHHVEEAVGVPFRYKKLFTGRIVENGRSRRAGWVYYVRIMASNGFPDGAYLENLAEVQGVSQVRGVGRGQITVVSADQYYALTEQELRANPWCTAAGPAGDPVELERARVGGPQFHATLPPEATDEEMIEALWKLPRSIVCPAYDAALDALATQLPMTIHEYPTGLECSTWIVPERWTCHEAYLETLSGERLIDYADHPLHVVSYSLPIDRIVKREELLEHLHVHPTIDNAIPFVFKYYERDWGLCSTREMRDALTDDEYRVVIRTSFSYDTLKVGEVVAKGESEDSIVLCAHLCHPQMLNDDLAGVVVGMRVMAELLKRKSLRYTYRFLIVPETIGSVAYLAQNRAAVERMKGGLFLEMLGLNNPLALQLSLTGNTEIDQCFTDAVRAHDPESWTGPFRTVIGNDERQFNGPGYGIPMLSLSRVLHSSHPESPYREYHTNLDAPAALSLPRLRDSIECVLRMIEAWEENDVPRNLFQGEVFCSRFGFEIDWAGRPEDSRALFNVMDLIDGTRSIASIARAAGVPAATVSRIVAELRRHGLVKTEAAGSRSGEEQVGERPAAQFRSAAGTTSNAG